MYDYYMAPGVTKTFRKEFRKALTYGIEDAIGLPEEETSQVTKEISDMIDGIDFDPVEIGLPEMLIVKLKEANPAYAVCMPAAIHVLKKAYKRAYKATDKATYQAMEGFIHNLNTMHSRAGAQVPFSSINYGTDTSAEGRMVIRNLLFATDAGLGNGETPIFPIQIFKVKDGVSFEGDDPNADLFDLACRVSAKRLFPNFSFLDAPFNLAYYKEGHPETEATYMGCVDGREVISLMVSGKLLVLPFSDAWNMFAQTGTVSSTGISEYIDLDDVKIYDSTKGFVKCHRIIKNADKGDWMRIKAQNGRTLLLTSDHPLYTDRGRVHAKDLVLGDKIRITDDQPTATQSSVSERRAYLLGSMMCDGCYNRTLTLSVGLDEEELADLFQENMEKEFSLKSEKIYQDRGIRGNYIDVLIKGNKFGERKAAEDYFLDVFGAYEKAKRRIPQFIFSATENARLAFIGGVIDCDGSVKSDDKGVFVHTGFVNKEMSLQLAQLLRSLGYTTKVYINHYKGDDKSKERYKVEFRADERLFSHMACKKKIKDLSLQKKTRELEWAAITGIEEIGFRDASSYDVTTESDKFDVSGIVSHNCRTRVIGNVCGEETVTGRGNLSFTSINLPRLAILAHEMYHEDIDEDARIEEFFDKLNEVLDLTRDQLLERMAYQATAKVRNFSFLMGQGVWRGSENLGDGDMLGDILKQGTLSIGFIGLAETLKALIGVHHGQSEKAQELGLEIVSHIREYCDAQSKKFGLNFTCLATPAEGLSGRFVRMDKEKYGVIEGVTDKEWYTNSFHIPVEFDITAYDKIRKEAPYHALTNAGHISYIELDGDTCRNLEAFKSIIRFEKECGMGYASVNHPVDRCPVCGYTGVIDNECPGCGATEDSGITFERIRRITGYLVGGMDRWNRAKAAEESHRVKHL